MTARGTVSPRQISVPTSDKALWEGRPSPASSNTSLTRSMLMGVPKRKQAWSVKQKSVEAA